MYRKNGGLVMRRFYASITVVLLLGGCAQHVWVKQGATTTDFTHDISVCDYQSELGTPDNYNGEGTMANAISAGISTGMRKGTLMNKCMAANGWELQRVAKP
jgi:hypothetical protein